VTAALPAAAGAEMPVVPLLENYDLPPPAPVDVMVDHLKDWPARSRNAWPKSSNNGCKKWPARMNPRTPARP
jgi:hypothetical protein